MKFLLMLLPFFLLPGCSTPPKQEPKTDPFPNVILNRPVPPDESSKIQECLWLKNEIQRQQGLAHYVMSMLQNRGQAPDQLFEAQQRVASMEARALQLGCPGPATPPIILPIKDNKQ